MPPRSRRALRGTRRAIVAVLAPIVACAGGGQDLLCRLLGRCEAEIAIGPAPELDLEPEPVALPRIEAGGLLLHRVDFAPGSAEIDAMAAVVLDVVADEILARGGIRVRIEGHADARGDGEARPDLAQRRADAVLRFLVRKGVSAERLDAVGLDAPPLAADPEGSPTPPASGNRVDLRVL